MKINRHKKRLKAVKKTFPFIFAKKCKCCNNEFVREPMWKVNRWGGNGTVHEWNYCTECCPTKEDVLRQIDTDKNINGIAFIDDILGFPEKDLTEYKKYIERIMNERRIK